VLADEETFRAVVEEDSTCFKPLGTLMQSFSLRDPLGKGKAALPSDDALGTETEYEVYHVRTLLCISLGSH
jgi:hypothetical protein